MISRNEAAGSSGCLLLRMSKARVKGAWGAHDSSRYPPHVKLLPIVGVRGALGERRGSGRVDILRCGQTSGRLWFRAAPFRCRRFLVLGEIWFRILASRGYLILSNSCYALYMLNAPFSSYFRESAVSFAMVRQLFGDSGLVPWCA